MSRLRIFDDQNGAQPLAEHEDPRAIAEALAPHGVRFERWPTHDDIAAAAVATFVRILGMLHSELSNSS